QSMQCPRCRVSLQATLEQTPNGRVEIDVCPNCKGVWFDGGELALLTSVGNSHLFDLHSQLLEGDSPSMFCPRHPAVRMLEREIATTRVRALTGESGRGSDEAPLRIDQCPQCSGIWFDGGELDELGKAMHQSRMAPFLIDPSIK